MRTIDINVKGDNINMSVLKAEQNDEQNNNYYFAMNKVETKETKEMI